ncbi:MAG TPA: hypothetical protein VHE12_02650 [bacterium]|nr:hypothetical protein [bacterium]
MVCRTFLVCFFVSAAVLADGVAPQTSKDSAFELWPAANGAAPTTFSKQAPAFQVEGKPWRFPFGTKVEVKVDATQVLRGVNPYSFGNNVAWWDSKSWFLDPDRIEKAKQSGIRFWRWPGGSASDVYHWDGKYDRPPQKENDPAHMNAAWAVSTDDFIQFCKATGSEAIVTANYGAARYADVQYAADLAARWVKYFNIEKKFKVRYWEIGNELYGNWEQGNTVDGKPQLTGDVYGKDLAVIADAMRKVDPDIKIGAVAYEKDGAGEWDGHRRWTATLLPELHGKADFLILHQYFMWPFSGDSYTNPTNEVLFGNLTHLDDDKASLAKMVEQNAPSESGLPVALTEFNLVNASPEPTIELINGLFTAEVLGEQLKAGYACSNYWDWKNGLDSKLRGDMAMLASGDNSTADGTPRPSYYAYALYSRAFGDHLVASESSSPTVKVYASRFAGGELGVVLINENDRNQSAYFDLTGFVPKGKLMGWILSGKDMNDKQVFWDGEPGPLGGGGPFPIDAIPPYRATFKNDRPLVLPVPARSAVGFILY